MGTILLGAHMPCRGPLYSPNHDLTVQREPKYLCLREFQRPTLAPSRRASELWSSGIVKPSSEVLEREPWTQHLQLSERKHKDTFEASKIKSPREWRDGPHEPRSVCKETRFWRASESKEVATISLGRQIWLYGFVLKGLKCPYDTRNMPGV